MTKQQRNNFACAPQDRQLEQTITEAVRLCAQPDVNCSLAGNYSPMRSCKGCARFLVNCSTTADCQWGQALRDELACYKASLATADKYLRAANQQLGSDVVFSAMLFDQEYFGVHYIFEQPDNQSGFGDMHYHLNSTRAKIDAVNHGNDAVYNATLQAWPHATIDQYQRGSIWQTVGDKTRGCDFHQCSWESRAHGLWCGTTVAGKKGEGNADVVPCGQTYYSLEERGTALSTNVYSVGHDFQVIREAFNRTVNSARAMGLSPPLVTPWVWLGGGTKRVVANFGGGANDEKWNYELINSWTLGLEINQPYYGQHPVRFAQWDAAQRVAFYPSMFGRNVPLVPGHACNVSGACTMLGMQQTPCGTCNIRLQHFIA